VAEQRFNAVMEVLRDGLTVIEVADRYGVSRQWVHGWLGRYRTVGLDALADRMGGIWLADGHELKAVTGIDVHSRFCVMAGAAPSCWGRRGAL
jgi:transposase-like protein